MECKLWHIPAILFLTMCFAHSGNGQWKNISSGSLPNAASYYTVGGTLLYRDGTLWVGAGTAVWMSSDRGLTWSDRTPSLNGDNIIDVDFIDGLHGVLGTYNNILNTTDGGRSWTSFDNYAVNRSVCFIASALEMISRSGTSDVTITRDGGLTWQFVSMPGWGMSQITGHRNGEIDMINWLASSSQILRSTDYGTSWTPIGTEFDKDCWSFANNPCNSGLTAVVNEETHVTTDGVACVYISTDFGASWRASHPVTSRPYFCGSVCISHGGAVFVQTTQDGILRSTDSGQSWVSIGGPNGPPDSRLFTLASGDTIFAADDSGGIWMTSNGGGSPLGSSNSISLSANTLFDQSEITLCDSARATLYIRSSCTAMDSILQFRIHGTAQGDYTIVTGTQDSVVIQFNPSLSGQRSAELILSMQSGGAKAIPLTGAGQLPIPLWVTTPSTIVHTDTLGGDVRIPIIIQGLDLKQTVELDLSFDSTYLTYHGTRSLNNTPLDVAGTTTVSSSRIRIPQSEINIDTICAFSSFSLSPESMMGAHIYYRNLQVVNGRSPCEYLANAGSAIEAIGPSGCGVRLLSNYLEYGKIFYSYAHPNPATNQLTLELDLPKRSSISISLWNVLGERVRNIEEKEIQAGHYRRPISLADFAQGTYYVEVTACGSTQSRSVQVTR